MYLEGKKDFYGKKLIVPESAGYEVKKIIIELMYLRKVNSIHTWFVENVQNNIDDCKEYYVTEENLKSLYDIICEVLKNHKKAQELLPTKSGFFFGSTEYGEYYFKDLKDTKEGLEKIFANEELKDFSIYYHSSW